MPNQGPREAPAIRRSAAGTLLLAGPLATLGALALWLLVGWVDALAFYVAMILAIGLYALRLAEGAPRRGHNGAGRTPARSTDFAGPR